MNTFQQLALSTEKQLAVNVNNSYNQIKTGIIGWTIKLKVTDMLKADN